MGMKLHSMLEPLLTKLRESAERKYIGEQLPLHPAPLSREEGTEIEEKIENDVHQVLGPELDSLITRFRGYYTLDDYDLDPLADLFAEPADRWETPMGGSVYCHVAQAYDGVDNVAKLVHSEQWTGKAAMAFHDNFLVPFKATAVVHSACARELAIAAKALAEAVELAKESVVWICKNAIFVLGGDESPGELPGEGAEGEGGFRKRAALTAILADTVALFLALTAPEFELLDVALATTGVGGGLIAESKHSSMDEPIDFAASHFSVRDTIVNIEQALGALDRNIAELDEKINRGLEDDLTSSELFEHPQARIPNPDLSPSAYKKLNFADDPEEAVDGVVMNVVRLYYAGYVTLPVAAAMYDHGVLVCAGARISGVQNQFPRSVPKFNEAADVFCGLLSAMRDELTSSGQAMVTAAQTYEAVDTYHAQLIRQYEGQIPPPNSLRPQEFYTPPPWLIP